MNKIYNVVYSEEHGTWVVCSELDKRGRKKSSRTSTGKLLASAAIMGASLASLPAQASTCGNGSTVASGGSCDMGVYTAAANDNKVGQALVTGGDSVTLTSPDINNITGNNNDRSIRSGKLSELFTDPAILAELNQRERLLANQKGRTVNVTDPATNSNQTVNVYNNVKSISAADVQSTVSTGNDIYVDMRLGTANGNGSKIIASLGDPAATMADETTTQNTVKTLIALKNSRLVQAEDGGSAEWVSKNRIYFEETRVASQEMAIGQVLFKPKTVTFNGANHVLNTVQDLADYNNNVLIPAIGTPGFANAGETQQAAYDRYFNEAAATESKTFRQNNPITIHPDSTLPIGERWVLAATGAGSTATIKNGGQIDVSPGLESSNGGGMLAENGGKAVIEEGAQLSGRFNSLTVRDAGSTAINNGVISGGFFASDNYDTTQARQTNKNDYYSLSTTINATNSGNFENNGIINLAGYTYQGYSHNNYALRVNNNATATNKAGGIINVAVNSSPNSGITGVRVEQGGTFNSEKDSQIFIGRTAQYDKNAPTKLIGNATDQVGILVNGSNAVVNHNGKITIGEQTQGATAIRVASNSDASTAVNLGTDSVINIEGKASGVGGAQPKQNVGIQAQNSGAAQITNAGTINVIGTNAVGENVVAEAGRTAKITNTATSKITVEEASANLVTRNYGIYADGQGTGKADVVADGTLTLKGDNVIGAHARGNSTMTVNSGMKAVFDNSTNAKNQIAYHINGGNAVANVAALTNSTDITTENSTMFRADAGGTVNASDLNVTASGKDAVILASDGADASGKASAINVNNGTYNLTGNGSSVALVSGGATASLKGTANIADSATGATIGTADGKKHGLNNQTVAGSSPNNKTKLVSELNTTTNAASVIGYTAQNSGTVEYAGSLQLNGSNSTAVRTLDNGTATLNGATVKANGTALLANGGTNNITVNGGTVSGTTNVFNSVAGVNTLKAENGAVLNGTMAVAAGTSNVSLNNATWNNNGNSTVTTLNNAGTVAFTAPTTPAAGNYKNITVNGDYTGNNGKLVVNTLWNSDADKDSDHLIIKGAASGKTVVSTPNGIIGNITKTTAQQFSSDVVTVEQPAANAAGQQVGQPDGNAVFTGTADTTNAGQAQLVLKSTAGGKNVYAWTLYATPAPTPAPAGHYIFAPGVSAYTLMPQVNQEIGYNTLSATLHERRGENQIMAWDECATCGEQAKGQTWARLLGRRLNSDGKERFNFETKMTGVQIGHDFAIRRNDKGGHNLTGVFAAYTHATTDFFDRYRAVGGVVVDDKFTGEGKTDAVSLGVSNTYYAQNGSYLDLVGQVSWLRNNYKARDSVSVKQNGWGAGLSAEVGRPFALGERAENEGGWMIEPQAQLMYQYVGLKNFNDGIRQVEQNGQHGLRGRLGARLAYNAPNSNLRTNTFYAVANVWNDFIKPRNIHIGADSVSEKRNTTWGELGLGAQLPLGKNAYLYGDARYERNLGGAKRDGYRGTVGFKYTWK
ncbi:autotransporter outer membrane beta-barrel domain-containing protein [Kingella denitrificans]|uniref:autotransporter outer membrane beta-barrel domain-containing protein n=2 Tax=Kingella denitrificans TaxID=502 RepID=UPI002889D56C|nr:autotransporter outer membrane beta-barrel domain-containing protein [Kingella denitrificans]